MHPFRFLNDGDKLIIRHEAAESPDQTGSLVAASPAACSDTAYTWNGVRNNGWTYRVNTSVLASGVTATAWTSEISLAESSLESGFNDCGKAQGASLFSLEMSRGSDVTAPAMTSTGGCIKDNVRIIDFGGLPSGYLGMACKWWSTNLFGDDPVTRRTYVW